MSTAMQSHTPLETEVACHVSISGYGTDEQSSDTCSTSEHTISRTATTAAPSEADDDLTPIAPWLPPRRRDDDVPTLGDEVEQFAQFMSLNPTEKSLRHATRTSIQQAARAQWPSATVKVYGSFAYGLSLPSSDLDLVVEDCYPLSAGVSPFLVSLHSIGYEIKGVADSSPTDVFIKAKDMQSDLIINITLTSGRSPVRHVVSTIRKYLQAYPCAGAAIMVLRVVLGQCSLTDVHDGGVSSYTITLMALHLLERYPQYELPYVDGGRLVKDFMTYYSEVFDYSKLSVQLGKPFAVGKVHEGDALSVCDPIDPTNNIAESSVKVRQLKAMLKYCKLALAKWDDDAKVDEVEAFRGRTPLSTIVAHRGLWARADIPQGPASPKKRRDSQH